MVAKRDVSKQDLVIERVSLDALHPDPANARKHSERNLESIRGSLKQFGQTKPLVVQASSGRIMAGNGTYAAMRLLGWTTCEVVRLPLDDVQATAYGIADNRSGELAQWDLDALDSLVASLDDTDIDMASLGFDEVELDTLLVDEPGAGDGGGPAHENATANAGQAGDAEAGGVDTGALGPAIDEAPEPPKEPVTKPGDRWQMGKHWLHCGDCLEVLRRLGKVADLIFTDLPYGMTANKWDESIIPFDRLWPALWAASQDGAATVMTATQPFATDTINSNRKQFRYDLVWDKINHPTGFLSAKKCPMRRHEIILVFGQTLKTYNPQMTHGEPYVRVGILNNQSTNWGNKDGYKLENNNKGERYPVSVLPFARIDAGHHPTQKPVALLNWIVRTYSNAGETVLDPTAGSGTTLIACEHTNRACIAIEQDPAYCDVAVARWEKLTGKKAKRCAAAPTLDKPVKAKPPKPATKKPPAKKKKRA